MTFSSAPYATVGGGFKNVASGHSTTIGGGYGNTNTARFATVGGGFQNRAAGQVRDVAEAGTPQNAGGD